MANLITCMCIQVPLFKHCDIRTMISIVERMQSAIYCPGEMMVREGTPGKAIFLINHGTAHVLKGGQVVVVLSDHEFFGEHSQCRTRAIGCSRSTSARPS